MNLDDVRKAAAAEREAAERLSESIVGAYAERWSPTKIAEAAGISKATVHRMVRSAKDGDRE